MMTFCDLLKESDFAIRTIPGLNACVHFFFMSTYNSGISRWSCDSCDDNDNRNFTQYKLYMGILWSRHHSWCCVKGRLQAGARRRRMRKYCQCGKGGRQFRRPKWLMFRRKRKLMYGCAPSSGSYRCCHEISPEVRLKVPTNKSILHATQIPSKSNLNDACACTKNTNCGEKMIHQAAMQNLCRFTVDAYFT